MAATVRMFTFSGIMTAPVASGSKQFSSDSIGLLKYPYLAAESIVATTVSAQETSQDLTPAGTELVFIQVQEGKAVHFEINSPNRSVSATVASPVLTGLGGTVFKVSAGWSISLLEHEIA